MCMVLITLLEKVCQKIYFFLHASQNGIATPLVTPAQPLVEQGITLLSLASMMRGGVLLLNWLWNLILR